METTRPTSKTSRAAGYLSAVSLFAASRLVALLAIRFADKFLQTEPNASTWDATTAWYRYLLRYDSGWYLRIAKEGYSYDGNNLVEQPVAFYPLYPLLIKALTYLRLSEAAAAVLIANAAIVAAIVLFFKLVRDLYDQQTALLSVAFVSFFPTSLFFSAGYPESLTFLFIVCFFLFLVRGRLIGAACFAGLCFATRSTGLVLVLPLMWEVARRYWRANRKRFIWQSVVCLLIATSGLWLYMIYLWAAFRAPFAFTIAQTAWAWNPSGNPLLLIPFRSLNEVISNGPTPNALAPWFVLLFIGLLIAGRKRLSAPLILFAAGSLLLPYLSRAGVVGFTSFLRYLLLVFPVFIVVAQFCRERVWVTLAIVGVSGAMLFWFMAMFAKWYWVA